MVITTAVNGMNHFITKVISLRIFYKIHFKPPCNE